MFIHAAVVSKIEEIAKIPSYTESCQQLLEHLNQLPENAPDEERLGVYRVVRDAKVLPEEVPFFLIANIVEQWVESVTEESAKMEKNAEVEYQQARLDLVKVLMDTLRQFLSRRPMPYMDVQLAIDEFWEKVDVATLKLAPEPADVFRRDLKRRTSEQLRSCGESAMADLLDKNAEDYEWRKEEGQRCLFG